MHKNHYVEKHQQSTYEGQTFESLERILNIHKLYI